MNAIRKLEDLLEDVIAKLPYGEEIEKQGSRAAMEARGLVALVRSGMLGIETPSRALGIAEALRNFGAFGSATRIAALRHGRRTAIADDRGELTFDELDEQVNRLANAFRDGDLHEGAKIGVMCRNHRAPLIVAFAGVRAGSTVVCLNTSFSAPQAKEVAEREGVELLVHDPEFAEIAAGIDLSRGSIECSLDDGVANDLDDLIATGSADSPPAPATNGRIVLLTSGTTGTPKGAPRQDPKGFIAPGAVLERLPMRAGEATVVSPPLFHGTGLLIALLSISLGSTLILRRRFDAEAVLDDIERYRATTICVVPIMLQRMLALDASAVQSRDLSSLRVLFCAGSQLPAEVAAQATERFGEVVYNLYGSTEVAIATIATPDDVREAPTSVGRPVFGSRVRVLDERGEQVPTGANGRIFVGTITPFEGYTGGGGKEIIDGLLATGDVGHFDSAGRLYIDGRDDEMIISGGENVYPREIEELLMTHPHVLDAAAIGVADEEFGERLHAFVVVREDQKVTVVEIQQFVKSNLAGYKSPREVTFMDELPRNPTGKVLKRELAEQVD